MWCFQTSHRVFNAQKLSSTYLCSHDSLGQLTWSHGPRFFSKHSLTLPCWPKQTPTSCNEGVFLFFFLFLFKPPPPSHPIPFAWWCGLILWCVWNIGNQILVLISHKLPSTSPYCVYSELCGVCSLGVLLRVHTQCSPNMVLYSHIDQIFTFLQQGNFISHIQECLAWWHDDGYCIKI